MDRPRKPLHSTENYIYPDETGREYAKILTILIVALLFSFIVTLGRGWSLKYVWSDFVAVVLILSAAYKMFHLEDFVKIHKSYDVLARRWPAWSYLYPFIETALGADFLLSNGSTKLYVVTMIFTGLTIAARLNNSHKRVHLQYACLSNLIRLPAATLGLIESTVVFMVSLALLFT